MDPSGPLAAVARTGRALAALVVPLECPGCGRWDTHCCEACGAALAGPARRREEDAPRLDRLDGVAPLPVWAVSTYAGAVRGVVVAWKDRGRVDLDPLVRASMRRAGRLLAGPVAGEGPLAVVPAPSTRSAIRSRGRDVVRGLAEAVARGLGERGCPATTESVLELSRRGGQVGRGVRGRGARLDRVRVRRRVVPPGVDCLLVDDVLTTGATLAACEDALVAAGARVLGGVVLAATPPPGAGLGRSGPDTPAHEYRPVPRRVTLGSQHHG